jgi:hypothetical protein
VCCLEGGQLRKPELHRKNYHSSGGGRSLHVGARSLRPRPGTGSFASLATPTWELSLLFPASSVDSCAVDLPLPDIQGWLRVEGRPCPQARGGHQGAVTPRDLTQDLVPRRGGRGARKREGAENSWPRPCTWPVRGRLQVARAWGERFRPWERHGRSKGCSVRGMSGRGPGL